jgi:single-strand DNA-binding protein
MSWHQIWSRVWEHAPLASGVPRQTGRKEEHSMNFNQLTIRGFIGKNAETKQLPNGIAVTKFSVATTRSWKDEKGEWKDKTQWHNVIAYGNGFAQLASRLNKGTHVFVQGELTTREYDRTIQVPTGKKTIEHVIQQLAVELKADTIRLLDRTSNSGASETPAATDDDVPL